MRYDDSASAGRIAEPRQRRRGVAVHLAAVEHEVVITQPVAGPAVHAALGTRQRPAHGVTSPGVVEFGFAVSGVAILTGTAVVRRSVRPG